MILTEPIYQEALHDGMWQDITKELYEGLVKRRFCGGEVRIVYAVRSLSPVESVRAIERECATLPIEATEPVTCRRDYDMETSCNVLDPTCKNRSATAASTLPLDLSNATQRPLFEVAFNERHEFDIFPSDELRSGAFNEFVAGWYAALQVSKEPK